LANKTGTVCSSLDHVGVRGRGLDAGGVFEGTDGDISEQKLLSLGLAPKHSLTWAFHLVHWFIFGVVEVRRWCLDTIIFEALQF